VGDDVDEFNALLTGVGGEGVLLTSVVISRAANIEGHEVRGTQLHGLAQRGGSIPTHVRFGRHVRSPVIRRGDADLLMALEPLESARYAYFASKGKTNIVIDDYQVMPAYAKSVGQKYPSMDRIAGMLKPFAKSMTIIPASNITSKELGNPVFGNMMCVGAAISMGFLPLKKGSIEKAIRQTVPRGMKENLKAFRMGLDYRG